MTTQSRSPLPQLAAAALAAWLAAPQPFAGAQDDPPGQGGSILAAAAQAASNLEIESNSTTFDETLGIARAAGNVRIRYREVVIEAEQAEFHQSSGKVFARDNVRVYKDGGIFTGQEIIYDTNTGTMTATDLRSGLDPLYYEAGNLEVPSGPADMLMLDDATFTTHDSANPNFKVRAKSMKIYPGDKVVMKGVKFYAGDTPFFYFPYLSQPLDDELGYYFIPGYSSPWGAFLLNQYGFMIGEHTLAQARLDLRSERGIAGGMEFKSQRHRNEPNYGRLFLYGADDQSPEESYSGNTREGSDIPSSGRYRLNLQHRVYLPGPEESTLYLDIDVNKLSDRYFYQDFFPSEFRTDPQPDNILNLVKENPWGTISLLGRFQLNDFFQTDERLELALDATRTPLGDTGFVYNGFTTAGVMEEKLTDARIQHLSETRDRNAEYLEGIESGVLRVRGRQLVDAEGNVLEEDYRREFSENIVGTTERLLEPRGYGRFDTYHEILYPGMIGNTLAVVPRAGAGYTDYSSIDAPGLDSFDRTIGHFGVDTSLKFSRRYTDWDNRALGVDGMIHVVQPYVNYSYVSTDEIGQRLTPIDRLTPTTRLRPVDLPLFTATDGISDWQIARIGTHNRFITRRNGGSHNWLSINTYFDHYIEDPEFDRDFSNLFNEFTWSPLPWLSARLDTQLPVFNEEMEFTEVTGTVNFMPTDWFQFGISHFYLNDHPFFRDSNLLGFNTYTRLSDDWGFGTSHRFEAEDNTLEFQQYQIYKDLSSWIASVGAIIRDNRSGDDEFGILLTLTLKAFPRLTIPLDLEAGGGVD